jgi:hypothetical protein
MEQAFTVIRLTHKCRAGVTAVPTNLVHCDQGHSVLDSSTHLAVIEFSWEMETMPFRVMQRRLKACRERN